LWGNLKQRRNLEYPRINGEILFKLFLTCRHPASYISDGHTALYIFSQQTYLINSLKQAAQSLFFPPQNNMFLLMLSLYRIFSNLIRSQFLAIS
jgi:hypothetical protein